jgi:hypothetical protein
MTDAAVAAPPQAPADTCRAGRWLLALALVCGVIHCRPLFSGLPLAIDEHASYWTIQSDGGPSVWERCQKYLATPPLGHWIQQGTLAVLGPSEWALRLPSAVAMLASILVVYRIGRDVASPLTGGAAAVLLAWHPLVLDEVRIARCYGWVVLLSACLGDLSLRWSRDPDRRGWPWLWGVTAATLVWTHYVAIPFIGLCGLLVAGTWLAQRSLSARRFGALLLGGVIVGGLALPLLPAVQRVGEWGPSWHIFATAVPWRELMGAEWWSGLPAALVAVWLLHERGAPSASPPVNSRLLMIQLAWLAFGLTLAGAIAQWGGQYSLASPRYRTSASVPAALLFAVLITRWPSVRAVIGGLVVGIAATWAVLDHPPWRAPRLGNPMDFAWRDMALHLEAHGAPGDPVFVQSGVIEATLIPAFYDDPTFSSYIAFSMSQFYLPSPHPRLGLPYAWQRPAEMGLWYRRQFNRTPGGRTWLAAALDTDLNQASVAGFETLIRAAGLQEVQRQTFGPAVLIDYRRP